jgi:hypothetical protein
MTEGETGGVPEVLPVPAGICESINAAMNVPLTIAHPTFGKKRPVRLM